MQDIQIAFRLRRPFWTEPVPARASPEAARMLEDASRIVTAAMEASANRARERPASESWHLTYTNKQADPVLEEAAAIRGAMLRSANADTRRHWTAKPKARDDLAHDLEDAAKILCAVATGLPVYAVEFRSPGFFVALERSTLCMRALPLGPTSPPIDKAKPVIWLGLGESPTWFDDVSPRPDQAATANMYWAIESFQMAAQRTITHAPSVGHAAYALRAMARRGHVKAFLKAVEPKRGFWVVDLPPEARSISGAWKALEKSIGFNTLRVPEEPGFTGFIVQSFHPMRNETRCFVVDNRLVGAVPVRRDDTVLDAVRPPHRKVEPRSSLSPSGARSCHDRVGNARRIRFARRLISEMRSECPDLNDYILDVADSAETGEPLAIELNALRQAGLYSMQPSAILEALLARDIHGARDSASDGHGKADFATRLRKTHSIAIGKVIRNIDDITRRRTNMWTRLKPGSGSAAALADANKN